MNNYVVFLLGSDSFNVSKYLRRKAKDVGMDTIYEICKKLTILFEEYDSKNKRMGLYSSLEKWLVEYKKEIYNYIRRNTNV